MRSRLMSPSWRLGTSESGTRGDRVTMSPSTNLMAWVRTPSLSESSSRMMSLAMAVTSSQQASCSSLMTLDFTIHCGTPGVNPEPAPMGDNLRTQR
ncbi:hypothetical protein AV530_017735 [Patagioenas fasciata monilis]|uniref:Uncharacterized protein n=1 Tax=Patagioenas fasciata monilis TaxID=372326 RepID=A0A1V4J964_PATFA|nr:hypothetical protein AV530_017735 [Patagioenas fasciata monilis]